MPRKWVVTSNAQWDINRILEGVVEYTGFESSAIVLEEALFAKFDLIAFMPYIGTTEDNVNYQTFCKNYRIIYRLLEDDVYILTVIHASRLYPRPN